MTLTLIKTCCFSFKILNICNFQIPRRMYTVIPMFINNFFVYLDKEYVLNLSYIEVSLPASETWAINKYSVLMKTINHYTNSCSLLYILIHFKNWSVLYRNRKHIMGKRVMGIIILNKRDSLKYSHLGEIKHIRKQVIKISVRTVLQDEATANIQTLKHKHVIFSLRVTCWRINRLISRPG